MDVVVPFSPSHPKTRLSPALSACERRVFAHVMLGDVLDALDGTSRVDAVTVLSTAPLDDDALAEATIEDAVLDVRVRVDDRPLTEAVNAVLATRVTEPSAATGDDDRPHPERPGLGVVMADLALATPTALDRLASAAGEVVIAPGRSVGTNALVVRHPDFRVDFHGTSYLDHRANADAVDADVTVLDSHRLATDVDEPDDLAEVLAHADGAAPDWLRDTGFALVTDDGRVRARRHDR